MACDRLSTNSLLWFASSKHGLYLINLKKTMAVFQSSIPHESQKNCAAGQKCSSPSCRRYDEDLNESIGTMRNRHSKSWRRKVVRPLSRASERLIGDLANLGPFLLLGSALLLCPHMRHGKEETRSKKTSNSQREEQGFCFQHNILSTFFCCLEPGFSCYRVLLFFFGY